ncbi:MAG: FRG domain-containing protein [Verrucomicrobia bacterium]|nr:FRG domain-containing protein [Verrucomicrobiota bacterium]
MRNVGRPSPGREDDLMTKWQDNYQIYTLLRKKWTERGFRLRLDGMIQNTSAGARRQCEFARMYGHDTPSEEDLILLDEVRVATEAAWEQGYPVDDVYCVALRLLRLPHICPARGQPTRVWRGQRKSKWPFQAKLFRPDNITKTEEHLKRLGSLSIELIRKNPALQEDLSFAIAQHYSFEAELATWLLDFTANPWVALFFASHQAKDGDTGIILEIACEEWSRLTADQFGYIRLVEVPGVPRIERQHAVFLEGSHSDIIEQYIGPYTTFKQYSGLVFTDSTIGIDEETLLSSEDPYLQIVGEWKSCYTDFKGTLPKPKGSEKLASLDYYTAGKVWAAQRGRSLSLEQNELVRQLAQFHESLQRRKNDIPVGARSLRTFRLAVEQVLQRSNHEAGRTLDDLLRLYLNRAIPLRDESTTTRAVRAIKDEWEKIFPTRSSAH